VGAVRTIEVTRANVVAEGTLDERIDTVMEVLASRGAFDMREHDQSLEIVAGTGSTEGPAIIVAVEPSRTQITRELLGEAASLATTIHGHVVAFGPAPGDAHRLAAWGADAIVALPAETVEEDVATALRGYVDGHPTWAIVGPSTAWGREVLSRMSCAIGAGLTGDAVDLESRDGRLVAWKPAFGGKLVVEILCTSPVQMATVRAGVLPSRTPRDLTHADTTVIDVHPTSRVRVVGKEREDDSDELASAPLVIGVGLGVKPDDYAVLDNFRDKLGAVYCATRKVTDKGWMPRARQVGITGHSIAPKLFISVGASGKFNHTVGVRSAGTIIAINTDPDAMIFDWADVGIVGDWREIMEALTPRLAAALIR
jgi:electron transfer flavoprotein alpha subunit